MRKAFPGSGDGHDTPQVPVEVRTANRVCCVRLPSLPYGQHSDRSGSCRDIEMVGMPVAPCWLDGLASPTLDGLDPAQEARSLLAAASGSLARVHGGAGGGGGGGGDGVTLGVVNAVFVLVQLALDHRSSGNGQPRPPSPAERAFRSALAPGALGLVTKLTAALQPREGVIDAGKAGDGHAKGEGPLKAAVIATARHLSAMEKLAADQNNTSALLIAHNGLAKLLKGRWPWLLGGVMDAPRLLAQLCRIFRDGLDQLQVASPNAEEKQRASSVQDQTTPAAAGKVSTSAADAGEVAHRKKFGRLLATFGTRMACLLRHLGPECPQRDRTEVYRLLAKAAAAVYPGIIALRLSEAKKMDASGGSPNSNSNAPTTSETASLSTVTARAVYPKAAEAFLSTVDTPPCMPHGVSAARTRVARADDASKANGKSNSSSDAERTGFRREAEHACMCYAGGAMETNNGSEKMLSPSSPRARRRHDPWEALDALRPPRLSPLPRRIHRGFAATRGDTGDGQAKDSTDALRSGSDRRDRNNAEEGGDIAVGPPIVRDAKNEDVDPLGAILLLCEAMQCEGRFSDAMSAGLPECCGWVLDHLATLFPDWVEAAVAGPANGEERRPECGGDKTRGSPLAEAKTSAIDSADDVAGDGAVAVIFHKIAMALGSLVSRRAQHGEFEEAQVQLVEGCACHPHPLCREVWCYTLIFFLGRCGPTAQASCVQTFADTAVDPRVSPRCRRRIARALALCASPAADAFVQGAALISRPTGASLRRLWLPRLRQSQSQNGTSAAITTTPSAAATAGNGAHFDDTDSRVGGDEHGRGDAACVMELLSDSELLSSLQGDRGRDGDDDLYGASVEFARATVKASLCPAQQSHRGESSGSFGIPRVEGTAEGSGCDGSHRGHVRGSPGNGNDVHDHHDKHHRAASLTAALTFLAAQVGPDGVAKEEEGSGHGGRSHSSVAAEVAAREAGVTLSEAVLSAGSGIRMDMGIRGRSGSALSAITRLAAKTDPSSLPPMAALLIRKASEGREIGDGLLALAGALACMGRQPCPSNESNVRVWRKVLMDGYAALYASSFWPVLTVAMRALETIARHADPPTAELLRRLVPSNRLPAFKCRLARREVYSASGIPIQLQAIRERGRVEMCILLTAAAGTAASTMASRSKEAVISRGTAEAITASPEERKVVLREGSNLDAMSGLLGSTVVGVQLLTKAEGGGVCITLRGS